MPVPLALLRREACPRCLVAQVLPVHRKLLRALEAIPARDTTKEVMVPRRPVLTMHNNPVLLRNQPWADIKRLRPTIQAPPVVAWALSHRTCLV